LLLSIEAKNISCTQVSKVSVIVLLKEYEINEELAGRGYRNTNQSNKITYMARSSGFKEHAKKKGRTPMLE
jgi:hypothetical protein